MLTLGKFRKLTKDLDDDVKIRFYAGVIYDGDLITQEEHEHSINGIEVNIFFDEDDSITLTGV